jgi:hypothetical protein
MPTLTDRRGTARRALIVLAIAAPLALATACGNQVVTGNGGKPPLLHLTDAAATRAMGVAQPACGTAPCTNPASPYVLVGTLRSDEPADQPVYRPKPATPDDATRVARALHLTGTPTRIHGGWVLRTAEHNRLAVFDAGSWTFGMDCFADQPIIAESLDFMCASASGGGVAVGVATASTAPMPTGPDASPGAKSGSSSGSVTANSNSAMSTAAPPPPKPSPASSPKDNPLIGPQPPQPAPYPPSPGPSEQQARTDAAPILAALGLQAATVTVQRGSPTTSVEADPTVDTTPASGWPTRLDFDDNDHVVSADGWLHQTTRGDSYPVITAQRAFDLLQQTPFARPEVCMVRKDGKPGCANFPPQRITGARLGLAVHHDDKGAILVPAWLFTVESQPQPIAQIAVDPAYLGTAPTIGPTITPERGGPVNPATPQQVPPAAPK